MNKNLGIGQFIAAALPLAWLIPNHYYPWSSAWPEGAALLMLALAMLLVRGDWRMPQAWLAFCVLSLAVITAQVLTGRISFTGDAYVAVLYLASLAGSISMGTALTQAAQPHTGPSKILPLMTWIVAAATISVGIALAQWTGTLSLGIWGMDLAPNSRPYANVAQPNHLATICFLGLCALGWLQQRQRIGRATLALAALWLAMGMVITSSRTGWLQLGFLVVLGVAMVGRCRLSVGRRGFALLGLCFVLLVWCWPWLNDALLLSSGRTAENLAQPGTRLAHWGAMLQALRLQPLWGYGWQQVSLAQLQVAPDRPFVGEYIEHSHNIILDLLIWNGIPMGLLLAGLAIGWYVLRLWQCRRGDMWWLLCALGGLLIHAMLEYPLEFAYFLIPFGLLVGAVDALATTPAVTRQRAWPMPLFGACLLAALMVTSADYLKAEQSYRLLRLESARIGASGLTTAPPKLLVLTQLEAFQQFAHTEARPGMAAADVEWMQRVALRYAYPPSLFRAALALGLNGQPKQATVLLVSLCRIHPVERCDEGRDAWMGLRQRYPILPEFPSI